jgi:hypothetical protein
MLLNYFSNFFYASLSPLDLHFPYRQFIGMRKRDVVLFFFCFFLWLIYVCVLSLAEPFRVNYSRDKVRLTGDYKRKGDKWMCSLS